MRPSPQTGTILLVEDRDDVRRATQRLLDRRGYRVLAAASAEEALGIVEKEALAIDVLVSDVVMPGMSGLGLAKTLVDRVSHVRVILMSGYADLDAKELGEVDPSVQFLSKPFDPAELTSRVARAILERRALPC